MQKGGVVVPLVTSDGPFEENLNGGHLEARCRPEILDLRPRSALKS